MGDELLSFDERDLKSHLSAMPLAYRGLFAASCAERALSVLEERSPGILAEDVRRALDQVWQGAENPHAWQGALLRSRDKIRRSIPSDESGVERSPLTTSVLSSVCYAIDSLLADSVDEPTWSARCVYEVLDDLVQAATGVLPVNPESEIQILSHPAIQLELRRQVRDVSELSEAAKSRRDIMQVVSELRRRSGGESSRF